MVRSKDTLRADFMKIHGRRPGKVHTSPRRVYEFLRSQIRTGVIGPEASLVENILVESLGASRNSVRKALQMLADEGLVNRQTKLGTNVARAIIPIWAAEVGPRVWAGTPYEGRFRVRGLTCEQVPVSDYLRERMGARTETVILLEEVAYLLDEPLYLRVGYCAMDVGIDETVRRLHRLKSDFPPFKSAFEHFYQAPFAHGHSSIEAVPCEPRTAELLHLAQGSPVLLKETISYDETDRARSLSFTHFRGDRVSLQMDSATPNPSSTTNLGAPAADPDLDHELLV